jgi:exosortase family protein XrtF
MKFFATYFILFAIYSVYLENSQQKKGVFKTSSITTKVAKQTAGVLNILGYNAYYEQHNEELSVKLFIQDRFTVRVIEGCNSISLIILFIAFIVAFAGSLKATLLFAVFGSVFIYGVNILRIAFLTLIIYKYPASQEFFHTLVFPAIIYGTIFLLWVLWVHQFSNYKK